jgi:hypothetical protein
MSEDSLLIIHQHLFATLSGAPRARLAMAHEREWIPLRPLKADERELGEHDLDGRWPVLYAIMFVTVVSVALWALIIACASWLIG